MPNIAEEVSKVRGQRSRSYVYKCVNTILAEAYISMVWRRGLLVYLENVRSLISNQIIYCKNNKINTKAKNDT